MKGSQGECVKKKKKIVLERSPCFISRLRNELLRIPTGAMAGHAGQRGRRSKHSDRPRQTVGEREREGEVDEQLKSWITACPTGLRESE